MWKAAAAVAITAALAASFVARAWADHHEAQAKVGAPAPDFTLKDQDGKDVKLADLKGKVVVLEWFNDGCPFVVRHYESKTFSTLHDKYKDKDVVHLAINSTSGTNAEHNKKFAEAQALGYQILDDSGGQVGKSYGAKTTPHMFIIDKEGKLVYAGGIDNDPNGDKTDGKVNYVEKALEEILAGESVSEPETKPYGCGVKYAS